MAENTGTIDSLLVSLGLETDAKSFQKGADAIKGVTDGMLQLAAVAGVGLGIKALTSGVANSALEMKRLSDNTGFTIRQIQGLEMAMRRLNLSPDAAHDIAKTIPELQRKAKYGELNSKAYWGEAFNPTAFSQMSQQDGLKYLIDSYQKMNYDQQAFLREGGGFGQDSPITRLMEMGPNFFRESQEKSDKNPYAIDENLLKNSQIFNDEMADLSRNFEVLAYSMGRKLLPVVNSLLDKVNEFAKSNPEASEGILKGSGIAAATAITQQGMKILGLKGLSKVTGAVGYGWSAAEISEPFIDMGLNGLFGGSDYFQNIRAAPTWGDFGNALLGNGSGKWINGKWIDPRKIQGLKQQQGGNLHDVLNNPNARSYLDAISRAEGTSGYMNSGYHTMFGGGQVASLADHPRQLKNFQQINGTWNKTSAAGRYQFTQKSWDEAAKVLGLNDFSPQSQDLAALWLIQRAGQLDNVLNGNFMDATNHLGGVWASLPSSPYAQPKRSAAEMEGYYLPDYNYQRSAAPYNPSASRSESSQPVTVTQHVELNISGLGLNEQQVQDSIGKALTETGENLAQSFNRNGW
ncbi:lysozyme [Prodigiosinella confusarubida]|uniref:Lysozyme n=1 Tax=Serratia sp. (strain ATCC 39006) TaxID=104623 RepID=A0A2I5T8G2_SERS3|nr:glycoside hydrolase family 104 protein [Serratia sp. ATCC 39006]AUH00851.1 lysozyme [Serratia sp. ATCC 39006]AUH05173.1 lysozyme [Serratia sp. ATCC 39006]